MFERLSFSCDHSRGFTLLEILIAIAILSIILSTVYAAYSGSLTIIRDLDDDSRVYAMARTTLDRMNRDLSSLQRHGDDFILKSDSKTIGSHTFHSLSFWSAAHLAFREDEFSGSPASISYVVKENKNGTFSLWRSDVLQAGPSAEKNADGGIIICEDIQSLQFTFFDESGRESSSWDTMGQSEGQKGKPPVRVHIVMLLVNMRDIQKPHRFDTRFFLPVKK